MSDKKKFKSVIKFAEYLWMSAFYIDDKTNKFNFYEINNMICDKQNTDEKDGPSFPYTLMKDCNVCEGSGFTIFYPEYCQSKNMESPRTFILRVDEEENIRLVVCPNCICWKCGLQNAYCGGCGCVMINDCHDLMKELDEKYLNTQL